MFLVFLISFEVILDSFRQVLYNVIPTLFINNLRFFLVKFARFSIFLSIDLVFIFF